MVFLVREDSGGKRLVGFCGHGVFGDTGGVGRNAVGRLRIERYHLFGGQPPSQVDKLRQLSYAWRFAGAAVLNTILCDETQAKEKLRSMVCPPDTYM